MGDDRRELTIELNRSGDRLSATYLRPPYGAIGRAEQSWSALGATWRWGGRAGLDAIAALLDHGDGDALDEHYSGDRLSDAGEVLFEALFGAPATWEPIVRALFDATAGPAPSPIRHPVRVRIWTDDETLAGLPWRQTAWRGKWLADAGWTFEVAASGRAERAIDLPTPSCVLVIAPDYDGMADLGTAAHLAALREALARIAEHYRDEAFLRVARGRDEVAAAFAGMAPQVVYYYGHGEVRGGQSCLLLGEPGERAAAVSLADFKRMMQGRYPLLACINACKSAATGWGSAGNQLTPEVPVVVANRTTAWSAQAAASGLGWLERCLGDGIDPVVALHRLAPGASTRDFQWATATVHAEYRSWSASRVKPRRRNPSVGLRLDRDQHRSLVAEHVAKLVQSEARRCESLVAYAEPGNLLADFTSQLRDHLDDRAGHQVRPVWRRLAFPLERADLINRLEHDLGLALDQQPGEPLAHLLRRSVPARDSSHATPLLWLDWGVCGAGHQNSLTAEEIKGWVELGFARLAHHCPPEMRVVSYLAIECPSDRHRELAALMESLRANFRSEQFRVSHVGPLAAVTLNDLLDYLEDPSNTSCPHALAGAAATAIFDAAAGNYERTIALIRRAEQITWHALIGELRGTGVSIPSNLRF